MAPLEVLIDSVTVEVLSLVTNVAILILFDNMERSTKVDQRSRGSWRIPPASAERKPEAVVLLEPKSPPPQPLLVFVPLPGREGEMNGVGRIGRDGEAIGVDADRVPRLAATSV